MKTLLKTCAGLVAIIVVGCGGSRVLQQPMTYQNNNPSTVDQVVTDLANDACQHLAGQKIKGRLALLDCYGPSENPTSLEQVITDVSLAKLSQCSVSEMKDIKLLQPDLIRTTMAVMELSPRSSNIMSNAKQWVRLGARIVGTSHWVQLSEQSLKIVMEFYDVGAGGQQLFSVERTMTKDDAVRRLMGERLPGQLVVESPSNGAKVYVDGGYKGTLGGSPLSFEVPYGSHGLRVEKEGFKAFSKSVFIQERGSESAKVKFTQAHTAPLKGMFLSAVAPGSASLVYENRVGLKNPAISANGALAVLFYCGAIAWVIDDQSKNDFLVEKGRHDYETIRNIELYSTLGLYLGNVITGWLVGNEYRKVSKRGVEYTANDSNPHLFVYSASNTQATMLKLAISF